MPRWPASTRPLLHPTPIPSVQAHSPALARHLKLRCKADHRVLLSSEGPFSSVIKVGGWVAREDKCKGCMGIRVTAWAALKHVQFGAGGSVPGALLLHQPCFPAAPSSKSNRWPVVSCPVLPLPNTTHPACTPPGQATHLLHRAAGRPHGGRHGLRSGRSHP